MSPYSVSQLAQISGVSVRTLHHYDEIGLLKPALKADNGYRYYGREELLRLQQILFHRELDFPLEEIRRVLDAPGFDKARALREHRKKLKENAKRFQRLVRTIDETLATLEGDAEMTEKAMYKGFDPAKQEAYEKQLVDRYGDKMQGEIDAAKQKMSGWKQADFDAMTAEIEAIEGAMAKALTDGLPVDSEAVTALMRRHHAWVAKSWKKPPPAAAYAGLAQLYLDTPEFQARYEARQVGLCEYLAAAIKSFAERELK